jgi:hypothetical protein
MKFPKKHFRYFSHEKGLMIRMHVIENFFVKKYEMNCLAGHYVVEEPMQQADARQYSATRLRTLPGETK